MNPVRQLSINAEPPAQAVQVELLEADPKEQPSAIALATPTQALSHRVAKRGRYHAFDRPLTSPDLFPDGKTDRIASNKVIWEGCNILTQGENLDWLSSTDDSPPHYESAVAKGKGYISFWITRDLYSKHPAALEGEAALALIDQFDIRAACIHLIYAAHATQLERPWEQSFVLSDTQLERYLGLDDNKKLNKQQKLQLMLDLAKQPCRLLVYVSWPEQGKVPTLTVSRTWLWEIAEPLLHFQACFQGEDGNLVGEKKLVGFTLKVRCGNWAEYFLNQEKLQDKTGYYEYGILSQGLLHDLMSTWHHNEGAARLMTWLLFKTKVNRSSPIAVETLMKVAFGEADLQAAKQFSKERKRIVRLWLTSLRVLRQRGWQLQPDPATYPAQYWVETPQTQSLDQIPDDPEEAVEFWAQDATAAIGTRITDQKRRLRGSFDQLLQGRLWVEPPAEIAEKLDAIADHRRFAPKESSIKKATQKPTSQSKPPTQPNTLAKAKPIESGDQLKQFRLAQGWSQADLATQMERSLSWVKMVEVGKRRLQTEDHRKLSDLMQ
jgi:Helix-turn-helix domain